MFEPINGTLGAIALLDPTLRVLLKTYKLYRLDKGFGEEFNSYRIYYNCEVARLENIGRTKVSQIPGGFFDGQGERLRLKETLRSRMELMFTDLKICEGLMHQYGCTKVRDISIEQRFSLDTSPDGVDSIEDSAGFHHPRRSMQGPSNSGSQAQSFQNSISGQTTSLSDDSMRISTGGMSSPQKTTSTGATSNIAELETTTGSRSCDPDPGRSSISKGSGWVTNLKRVLKGKGIAKASLEGKSSANKSKPKTIRDLPGVIISDEADEVVTAGLSYTTFHEALLEDERLLMKKRSVVLRVRWAAEDRQTFIDTVERIVKHNDFFESMLNVNFLQIYRQCEGKRMNVDEQAPERIVKDKGAFNQLQGLLSNQGHGQFLYSLWLNGSASEFAQAFEEETGRRFKMQNAKSVFTVQMHQVSASQELSKPTTLHVAIMQSVFDNPDQRVSLQDLYNIHSVEPAAAGNEDCYDFAGEIFDRAASAFLLKMVHDRTAYFRENSLRDFINDNQEMGTFEYIRQRKLLAKLITLSILQAGDLALRMDNFPSALQYYLVKGQDEIPSSEARTSVYLDLLHHRSSASAFRKHLGEDPSSRCRTLMRQLGTLLLEIGRWRLLSSDTSYSVKLEEIELLRDMGPYFVAAVQQCFRWNLPGSQLDINAVWSRVICPIQKSLDDCLTETEFW